MQHWTTARWTAEWVRRNPKKEKYNRKLELYRRTFFPRWNHIYLKKNIQLNFKQTKKCTVLPFDHFIFVFIFFLSFAISMNSSWTVLSFPSFNFINFTINLFVKLSIQLKYFYKIKKKPTNELNWMEIFYTEIDFKTEFNWTFSAAIISNSWIFLK